MSETPTPPIQPQSKTSALAIWSLVLGILSYACLSVFASIPAVICGHMASSRIKKSGGALQGGGLALAGLITGYVNIALAIVLIPMMLAIAIPNFVKARETAQKNLCIYNLQRIEQVKRQWSQDHGKTNGEPVDVVEINRLLGQTVSCPAGGTYTYGPVGAQPTCSHPNHRLPAD